MNMTYGYTKTGAVKKVLGSVNGANENDTYKYDSLQRLTNYTVTSHSATTTGWYQYDNLGNRLSQKSNSTITQYSYNAVNQLTSSTTYSTPQITTSYSYDLNGNLKAKNVTISGSTTKWAYRWDTTNHLLYVTSNGIMQGKYAYDGAGRKLESIECTCSDIWFYAYTGSETLWQTNSNWGSVDFLSINGLKVASVDSSQGGCFCTVKYYHLDALGSARLVTNPSKIVTFNDGYQPFGQDNGTPYCSSTCETYKFTAKPVSTTTGLYYYGARWYDSAIGSFISPDPLSGGFGSQRFNPYIYVEDAPT